MGKIIIEFLLTIGITISKKNNYDYYTHENIMFYSYIVFFKIWIFIVLKFDQILLSISNGK
jgi:hypothetical protein